MCRHMNQGFWWGLGGGGVHLETQRNPDVQGSYSIPKQNGISDRS